RLITGVTSGLLGAMFALFVGFFAPFKYPFSPDYRTLGLVSLAGGCSGIHARHHSTWLPAGPTLSKSVPMESRTVGFGGNLANPILDHDPIRGFVHRVRRASTPARCPDRPCFRDSDSFGC